jgi:hypothetical protein
MPFVHLPVQSGSDRILAAMNRRHTASRITAASSTGFAPPGKILHFHRILSSVSPARPRKISSPPSPGHTNRIRWRLFVQIFAAARNAGADMEETVSAAEMDERLVRLQELIDSQQSAFNVAAIGRTVDVLFERPPAIPARSSAARLSAAGACDGVDRYHRQVPRSRSPKPRPQQPVRRTGPRVMRKPALTSHFRRRSLNPCQKAARIRIARSPLDRTMRNARSLSLRRQSRSRHVVRTNTDRTWR